jgi:hypothetical protein
MLERQIGFIQQVELKVSTAEWKTALVRISCSLTTFSKALSLRLIVVH